uniref:Uncharacterized protein n=1 Tax=Anguilla anguilla TaxID=7936 RepID=A0A0E9UEI6_ANGAN
MGVSADVENIHVNVLCILGSLGPMVNLMYFIKAVRNSGKKSNCMCFFPHKSWS